MENKPEDPLTADDLVIALPGFGLLRYGDMTEEQRAAYERYWEAGRNNTALGPAAIQRLIDSKKR